MPPESLWTTATGSLFGWQVLSRSMRHSWAGKPKFRHGVKNKRGRGTGKPIVLVAAACNGQERAVLIPNARGRTMIPIVQDWIDSSSTLITDKNSSYRKIGTAFAGHLTAQHNKRQYADQKTGAHTNTVEAVNAVVRRTLVGVYHRLGRKHLQRYLDEIPWRWNHRVPEVRLRKRSSSAGSSTSANTVAWKPIPVVDPRCEVTLLRSGPREVSDEGLGLRWP